MRIGMLGAGHVAQAVASHAVSAGHQVVLSNRRGPAVLAPVVERLGPLASAGTPEEAAHAELVLLAVWWTQIPDAIAATAVTDWEARIVIDATNEFVGTPPDDIRPADLGDVIGSEYVASMLPGARVVKAFNTMSSSYIAASPRHSAGRQIVFLAGDDPDANRRVAALVEQFGFAAVNLGGLRESGRLMQIGGPLSLLYALKQGESAHVS
jgi:8-hydroxy-5-deazaflavin:NADPH oxidoreductase